MRRGRPRRICSLGGIISAAFIIVALAAPATPAAAQLAKSHCADCYFARPDAPAQDHLRNWDGSLHGRNNVGCERCHGGNPGTFETLAAHATVLNSANAKSPANRRNLPATCGSCHIGPFVAFQDSRHYELLQAGKNYGPTCSTCHDAVSGTLLSPKALESRCGGCHGPDEIAPRAERARNACALYERIATVRTELKLARTLIKRIADRERRAELEAIYDQAEVPLTRAVHAGHRFVYDELREYSGVADARAQALLLLIGTQTVRTTDR